MKANYHTHTTRCNHAEGSDEEMVLAAIDGGFSVLGFADHVPWPYQKPGHVSRIRMTMDDLPGYVASISALRERYADRIAIHTGVESEYYPRYADHLRRLHDSGLYLILGHHYYDSDEDNTWVGQPAAAEDDFRRYGDMVAKAIGTGLFTYVAHPDLFMKRRCGLPFTAGCREAAVCICQAAKEAGIPIEYNLIRYAENDTALGYPCADFWQIAKQYGNDVVLGVDVHAPYYLRDAAAWQRGVEEVAALGLNRLETVTLR